MFKQTVKSSIIYTVIIVLLFLIPGYQILSTTMQEQAYKNKLELLQWSIHIESKLQKASNVNEFSKLIPFSLLYHTLVFNENHELVFTNTQNIPSNFKFSTKTQNGSFFYQRMIKIDHLGDFFVIVEKEISYLKLILISFAIIFFNIFVVFVTLVFMHNNSIKPYREAQDYLNNFFNDAMHELKTPLGIISINLELLEQATKELKYVNRIKAALKQMQMTYEDVEYHIKHSRTKFNLEIVNLTDFTKERIRFFLDIANTKEISFNVNLHEKVLIYMNKVEIGRIVDNTISNAIKYSNSKTIITISLKLGAKYAILSISDQGRGIKDIDKIFARFEREDIVQGGFGLGLNIVKNICQKSGIIIKVDSKIGTGSTFCYKIPLYTEKLLDKLEVSTSN